MPSRRAAAALIAVFFLALDARVVTADQVCSSPQCENEVEPEDLKTFSMFQNSVTPQKLTGIVDEDEDDAVAPMVKAKEKPAAFTSFSMFQKVVTAEKSTGIPDEDEDDAAA